MMIDVMLAESLGTEHIKEQLAVLQRTGQYAAETKWDGVRALVRVEKGRVVDIMARRGVGEPKPTSYLQRFPDVVKEVEKAIRPGLSALLDAEVGVLVNPRVMDHHRTQSRRALQDSQKIRYAHVENPLTICFFDVLKLGDEDVRSKAYAERHELLYGLVTPTTRVRISEQSADLVGHYEEVCSLGGEGIMVKLLASPYESCEPGRKSKLWVKAKAPAFLDDLDVVGLTYGSGHREELGSLVLAKPTPEGFEYVCRSGSGLRADDIQRILEAVKGHELAAWPTKTKPDLGGKPLRCWIRPGVVKASIVWEKEVHLAPRFPRVRDIKITPAVIA